MLKSISQHIDRINEKLGKVCSWFTLILVLLVFFDVLRRYLFNASAAWIMELEWHIFALIFLFGAAFTFKHDKHVRVDLFYDKCDKKDKAWINFIGTLLFLIPWTIFIIYFSYSYASNSFSINEGSPDPGGLPARYIIKFCIPLGMTFLFLQAFSELIKSWLLISNKIVDN